MISRTRMITLVRNFSADEVSKGLDEKPELLRYRDERGRNRLHLCAGVDVCKDVCKDVCRDVSRKTNLNTENSVRLGAVLLERGLDINAPAFTEGSWCATSLWYAVGRGHNLPLAKFLLKSGSTPEHCLWAASFSEDLEMLRLLIEAGASLEAVAEGETPLLGAVKTSKFRAARLLLDAGCDPDYQDARGMTALHYMLKKNSDKKHIGLFVKYGAGGYSQCRQHHRSGSHVA